MPEPSMLDIWIRYALDSLASLSTEALLSGSRSPSLTRSDLVSTITRGLAWKSGLID